MLCRHRAMSLANLPSKPATRNRIQLDLRVSAEELSDEARYIKLARALQL